MRRIAVLAAALVLAAAVALWWIPRWLAGDAARERLIAAARDATGRDVAIGGLSLALFPPRLVARDVRVGDAAAPLVTAERVDLRVDPAALLSRTLVVEALVLDGITWRVPRNAGGVALPWAGRETKSTQIGVPEAAVAGAAGALQLAVERITLARSQLVWEDTVAAPAVRIEVGDVAGEATGAGPGAPLAMTLSGTLASGGTLRLVRDPAKPEAPDLEATLDGVDLAVLAPYLGKDLALAGRVGGTLRAHGRADALDALDAALEIADANVRAGDVVAKGPVGVTAKLSGALEALTGSFELDATRASLDAYGGVFKKPPGAPAKATGKLLRDAKGRLGVDGVRVKIENMGGQSSIGIEGTFFADASQLRSEGLVARIGGQPVAIELRTEGLAGEARHRTRIATREADARALFAALTGRDDLLEGPLTFDATLAGPLGEKRLDGLGGSFDLALGAGRIPDVSPLREALRALDGIPEVAQALDREKTERKLAPYLGDRFESIRGHFEVGDGHARSKDLELRYPGYRLELRGAVGLADQGLDAKGRVVLEPELEATLAGDSKPDGDRETGGARVIDIARIGGSIARPKLELDQAGAVAFAASLALVQKRDKWERKLDRALGDGAGKGILDALDGILGKKERR